MKLFKRNPSQGGGRLAKRTASLLAAVAVAGGVAVVGMPMAHAAGGASFLYFEKVDQDGNPLGGSEWVFTYGETNDVARNRFVMEASGSKALDSFKVVDNLNLREEDESIKDEDRIDEDGYFVVDDRDPRPGHFAISPNEWGLPEFYSGNEHRLHMEEVSAPEGYGSCGDSVTSLDFYKHSERSPINAYIRTGSMWDQDDQFYYQYRLRETGFLTPISSSGKIVPVTDERIRVGAGVYGFADVTSELANSYPERNQIGYLPETVNVPSKTPEGEEIDPRDAFVQYVFDDDLTIPEYWVDSPNLASSLLPIGAFVNCKVTPEPTPPAVTETTTVTPPTTTVTLPSTVTTTVTPPAATVTETPKKETTTATTTESATTTVTETPQTETVTETPQRETVTLTPEKETVTETPKTETVTHTPDKETVTETPKTSTETSTVTAPQVTVTETPNQVTETVTLPQKTVTEHVPTTVVENKTETVKLPPATVTETEKQEPVTVTETPEKTTETVNVPGEKTTVVETKPGESVTVTETPREDVAGVVTTSDTQTEKEVVNEETPEVTVSEESTPQSSGTNTPRILASTGANITGLVGIAGLLIGAAVFVTRRKK